MGEDDEREVAHAHLPQLACDVRLGRALVHEDSPARDLQEHAVALADVEERDAKAVRRGQRRSTGAEPPTAGDQRDEQDQRNGSWCARRA